MNKIFDARSNGNRKPVWQFLGQTFDVNINVSDAMVEIGGDFEIQKTQLYTTFGGHLLKLPNEFAIIREMPDKSFRKFGKCGSDFQIIQRWELSRMFDGLTTRWPLETAGLLKDGKTFFFVLNAGKMEINGDEIVLYFIIMDTVDGGTAIKALFTPIRLRCQNALVTALKTAVINVSILHRTNVHRDVAFTVQLTQKMLNAESSSLKYFQYIADTRITPEQATRIFEKAYPIPNQPSKMGILDIDGIDDPDLSDIKEDGISASETFEYYVNRAMVLRESAQSLYEEFNSQQPRVAGTAWAAFNSVVELADWRTASESSYVDSLFGQRATEKRRAFNAISEVVK